STSIWVSHQNKGRPVVWMSVGFLDGKLCLAQSTPLRSAGADSPVHFLHKLRGRYVACGPQARHQRRRTRVQEASHQSLQLITWKYFVHPGVTRGQRDQLRVQLQIHQAVKIQLRVGKLQKRKHWIVAPEVSVGGEVKVTGSRRVANKVLARSVLS